MSVGTPPPPPPPPPPSPPPPPPPSGPPPSGPPRGRSRTPWIVGGALVAVIAVVVVLVVTLTGSEEARDARSVQDVADVAVAAAEDLDVDAAIDLLCEPPDSAERDQLEAIIDEGRERAGTDDPDVDYDVSEVEGDATGSFMVRISSDEEGLRSAEVSVTVTVEQRGERSCIADIGS